MDDKASANTFNIWQSGHWIILAVVLAVIYLLSMAALPYPLHFAVKAAPIVWLALCCRQLLPPPVRTPMCLALLFSACGDVLLALTFEQSFAAGLSAFLCAQLLYCVTFFRRRGKLSDRGLPLAAIGLFYGGMLWLIIPETGTLKIPVLVYMTAICTMGALAVLHRGSSWVLLGALSFMVSDSVIAINRFLVEFEGARLVIMNTYYLAQIMIVAGMVDTYRKGIEAGND